MARQWPGAAACRRLGCSSRRRPWRILRGDGAFRVTGPDAEALGEEELSEALRLAGAKPGDPVQIGDRKFPFA